MEELISVLEQYNCFLLCDRDDVNTSTANDCKDIVKRSESMQNNLNNFDKDMQKEKDNSRSLWLTLPF